MERVNFSAGKRFELQAIYKMVLALQLLLTVLYLAGLSNAKRHAVGYWPKNGWICCIMVSLQNCVWLHWRKGHFHDLCRLWLDVLKDLPVKLGIISGGSTDWMTSSTMVQLNSCNRDRWKLTFDTSNFLIKDFPVLYSYTHLFERYLIFFKHIGASTQYKWKLVC